MYSEFYSIHKDQTLASIAWRIHKLGNLSNGNWKIRSNCYKIADTLVRKFKERELKIRDKKEDKYL